MRRWGGGQVLALPGLMPKGVDSELWSGHPPGGGALAAGQAGGEPFCLLAKHRKGG